MVQIDLREDDWTAFDDGAIAGADDGDGGTTIQSCDARRALLTDRGYEFDVLGAIRLAAEIRPRDDRRPAQFLLTRTHHRRALIEAANANEAVGAEDFNARIIGILH